MSKCIGQKLVNRLIEFLSRTSERGREFGNWLVERKLVNGVVKLSPNVIWERERKILYRLVIKSPKREMREKRWEIVYWPIK